MEKKFEGFTTNLASMSRVTDWEVYYVDKWITGELWEEYSENGDYDWSLKIDDDDKLTDDELDEIYDYIKENIKNGTHSNNTN